MNKTINRKRIIAYLLDIILVYMLISAIVSIRFLNPNYDKYIDSYEKYIDIFEDYSKGHITEKEYTKLNTNNIINVTKYSISSNIVIILVIIGYFVFFQKYNNGQTLGKKIKKIKVVSNDNKKLTLKNYFLRILPLYYIFIGGIIPIIISSILVFILPAKIYITVNSLIIYAFFILATISFAMAFRREDKRTMHDILANTKVVEE